MKPFCSVVMVSYNRADLLCRSVSCYNKSNFDLSKLEIVVVDDGSTDHTSKICELFDSKIEVKYVKLRKPDGLWRDCAVNINHGIRICSGHHILLTHPEVMVGRDTIAQFCDNSKDWQYTCAKPYYLSARDQERLDTVNWMEEGPLAVRKIEGFYEVMQHAHGNPDYTPWAIESVGKPNGRHKTWDSWVVGGYTRDTMKKLGGWIETKNWGTTDLVQLGRRHILGIPNVTLIDDSTLCVHQNHDAPRNIDKAHAEAGAMSTNPYDLVYPATNNLW